MIHKEGFRIIGLFFFLLAALVIGLSLIIQILWITFLLALAALVFFGFILWFFRIPKRQLTQQEDAVICPADGKVVAIENIIESEYFKDERTQISIFMSPTNIHINWYPISGKVSYFQYHPGKYLVAWHPKSSTENERTTVVLDSGEDEIMFRQIAGAVARRIISYAKVGEQVAQATECGFIRFGSRVDVILPPEYRVQVELNQKVQGGTDVLAVKV